MKTKPIIEIGRGTILAERNRVEQDLDAVLDRVPFPDLLRAIQRREPIEMQSDETKTVLDAVNKVFPAPPMLVLNKGQTADVCLARRVAATVMRDVLHWTVQDIARQLNFGESNCSKAITRTKAEMKRDKAFRAKVDLVKGGVK